MSASQAENAGSIPVPRFYARSMKTQKYFFGFLACIRRLPLKESIFLLLVLTAGCATVETRKTTETTELPKPEKIGVYHKVKPGETIWRIATAYNVSIEDIIKTNNIPDIAKLEENQLLFVPGALAVKEIPSSKSESENEFAWPAQGKIVSYFHEQRGNLLNKGIDIQTKEGEIVTASRAGQVVFADFLAGYGYTVILNHAGGYHTVYAHNGKLLVKLDQVVLKNQAVAQVGHSNDAGYLHFEVRKNSVESNPLYYLP